MVTVGIFVGGASRRMGGAPKGLLPAPDRGEPLVVRAARVAREAGLSPCLVGRADAYVRTLPDLAVIDDAPAGIGPLGGLRALLDARGPVVIALACDMPWVDVDALSALRDATGTAPVVAARRAPDAPWEPLLARYDARAVIPAIDAALAAGERSFQAVLRRLPVAELTLPPQVLQDWDAPEDLPPRA